MLVHKASMGVLEYIWAGQHRRDRNGVQVPLEHQARLSDMPDLDPNDWWEIPSDCALARRLKTIYPFCDPVTGPAGELVDVLPWEQEDVATAREEKRIRREEAQRRGYCHTGRVRPKHLMPFLRGGE